MRLLFILSLLLTPPAWAEDVILAPESFISGAFDGTPPPPRSIWLTGELGAKATSILGEKPRSLRLRYWRNEARSAWILEAIGKESPITAGFVIDNDRLSQAEVLIYRESRGSEIRFRSFLQQFFGAARLDEKLDQPIDNISSATLSVNAMKRMATLALFLDETTD